jgi:hypothetical protein
VSRCLCSDAPGRQLYRASSGVGELPPEAQCRNDTAGGGSPKEGEQDRMRGSKSVETTAVVGV